MLLSTGSRVTLTPDLVCLQNALTSDGSTALHLAASNGHLPVVQWLVSAGADTTLLDRFRRTAEQTALSVGENEVGCPMCAHSRGLHERCVAVLLCPYGCARG